LFLSYTKSFKQPVDELMKESALKILFKILFPFGKEKNRKKENTSFFPGDVEFIHKIIEDNGLNIGKSIFEKWSKKKEGSKNRYFRWNKSTPKRLVGLYLNNLNIRKLDIPKDNRIITLHCNNNALVGLNLSEFSHLWNLQCNNNKIEKLDVSQCKNLRQANLSKNEITTLNLTSNINLTNVICTQNKIRDLYIPLKNKIEYMDCSFNFLSRESMKQNDYNALEYFYCMRNNLEELDLKYFPSLFYLDCSFNEIKELNLYYCVNLVILDCTSNLIHTLDVSPCHHLENLIGNENPLEKVFIAPSQKLLHAEIEKAELVEKTH
jgi:hypothetical protein